ncbi:MAG: hypothetical protein K1X78_18915 [Verrucomicrobiaceae bacterium]|nr:hypothetical protein [Verrucomicrobiaceae bacterium]
MSALDKIESDQLSELIGVLQKLIFEGGGSLAATTSMLVAKLAEAQSRAGFVDVEVKATKQAEEKKQLEQIAGVVRMAERETALSREEKREYASFLTVAYFTRGDFNRLDKFYTHTWDRLSEQGKDEMSRRVWEGVHRGEYKFSELPESVKSRESDRVHSSLTQGTGRLSEADAIPAADRTEFVQRYSSGESEAAYRVLDRPCFADALSQTGPVFIGQESTAGRDALKTSIREAVGGEARNEPQTNGTSMASLDVNDALLESLRATALPSSPDSKGRGPK